MVVCCEELPSRLVVVLVVVVLVGLGWPPRMMYVVTLCPWVMLPAPSLAVNTPAPLAPINTPLPLELCVTTFVCCGELPSRLVVVLVVVVLVGLGWPPRMMYVVTLCPWVMLPAPSLAVNTPAPLAPINTP